MPDDIMSLFRVAANSFRLAFAQEFSGLGSGAIRAKDLHDPLWTCMLQSTNLSFAQYNRLQARIERQRGSLGSFYVWNPTAQYPAGDPGGTILGSSAVTIHTLDGDNKRMRLEGLPPGYEIAEGEMLAFDYGSNPTRRGLHRIFTGATADGSGVTPLFEVGPHIRQGATTGLTVILKRPAAEMILVPGSFDAQAALFTGAMTISAIQKI